MPRDWGPLHAQELWEHAGLGPSSCQAEQMSTAPPSLSILYLPDQDIAEDQVCLPDPSSGYCKVERDEWRQRGTLR